MKQEILKQLDEIKDEQLAQYQNNPERTEIVKIIKLAQLVMFPDFYHYLDLKPDKALTILHEELNQQVTKSLNYQKEDCTCCNEISEYFLAKLPEVKKLLLTDIQAIYDGDPACQSKAEVLLSYPGFYAITIHRLAHILYKLKVPYLPRIMSEYAHEKTGIDIHPGASIGAYFCIDHGSGIVIGETCEIGQHVKLYQGVTLGAKSFNLDEDGNPVKGGKRHPKIGDNVVIYANATILGGDTFIADDCVIGGNVWLTHSTNPGETIYYKNQ